MIKILFGRPYQVRILLFASHQLGYTVSLERAHVKFIIFYLNKINLC